MNTPKSSLFTRFALAGIISLLLPLAVMADDGTVPLLKIAPDLDLTALFTCRDTTVALDKDGDASVVSVKLPANKPAYAVALKPASGSWDCSAAKGIRVVVTNKSAVEIPLTFQVENQYVAGTDPFNKEGTTIAPGETRTVEVTFGKSFGHAGYALNPAAITGVTLYGGGPAATVDRQLLIRSVESFVTGQ